MKRTFIVLATIPVAALVFAACSSSDNATSQDQNLTSDQASVYAKSQPIPKFNFSQYRQTLIDVETGQANTVATTTFFYNQGSNVPIKSCPSIGFPLPSTAQLTNPQQVVNGGNSGGAVTIGQQEMTGVFTGNSNGTYVICVGDQGPTFSYWEGFVDTEGGPAHFDKATGQIVADGAPTVKVKIKTK